MTTTTTNDIYATITTTPPEVQELIAGVMELRAAQPAQREMLESYLAELPLPDGARVLEVGCGTGAVARVIAADPRVGEVVGVDPCARFVELARERVNGGAPQSFLVADGRVLPDPDETYDAVVLHTVLCHTPQPEELLAEAHRVLRPGGSLAVFDNDPVTATVANGPHDPLQVCIDAALDALVHDPYLARKLTGLVRAAGFEPAQQRSHGYAESGESAYLLSVLDRGADALAATGRIGPGLAEALKAEARERIEQGTFAAQAAYASVIGRKR